MSDSGASPPSRPPLQQARTILTGRESLPGRTGAIEQVHGALRALDRTTRIEGTVTQQNRDGSVRIQTAQGEMDVRLSARDTPSPGQLVDVQIAPGKPPRQAVIRFLSENIVQERREAMARETITRDTAGRDATGRTDGITPQRPTPAPPPRADAREARAARDAERAAALTRLATPSVPPATTEDIARAAATRPIPQIPVQEGDIVRITPITPEQAATLAAAVKNEALQAALTQIAAGSAPTTVLPDTGTPAHAAAADSLRTALPLPTDPALASFLPGNPAGDTAAGTLPAVTTHLPSTPASLLPATAPHADSIMAPDSTTPWQNRLSGRIWDAQIVGMTQPTPSILPNGVGDATSPPAGLADQTRMTVPQAGTVTAAVIGKVGQSLPVLSIQTGYPPVTAMGADHFVMQISASNLPIGSTLDLLPQAAGQAALTPGTTSPHMITPGMVPLLPPVTAHELWGQAAWPAMEDLAQTLNQTAPTVLQGLGRTILPHPGQPTRLPAAALLFIAAVRAGDLSSWLGDKTIDNLRRAGRADIVTRLGRDAEGLGRLGSEPLSQDWRGMALPLYWQDDIRKMMLYYRQDRSESGDDTPDTRSTRFIFDLSLNRMGAVQLDGLHRPQTTVGARLDLIVRTRTALSGTMQQHMRRLYTNALDKTALLGELSFQNRPDQWITIDLPRPDGASLNI